MHILAPRAVSKQLPSFCASLGSRLPRKGGSAGTDRHSRTPVACGTKRTADTCRSDALSNQLMATPGSWSQSSAEVVEPLCPPTARAQHLKMLMSQQPGRTPHQPKTPCVLVPELCLSLSPCDVPGSPPLDTDGSGGNLLHDDNHRACRTRHKACTHPQHDEYHPWSQGMPSAAPALEEVVEGPRRRPHCRRPSWMLRWKPRTRKR